MKLGQRGQGEIMTIVVLALVIWIGVSVWNWGYDKFGPKTYMAFFYPEPLDLTVHRESRVDSLEACRQWVRSQASVDGDGQYDYECGVNCEKRSETSMYVCQETIE